MSTNVGSGVNSHAASKNPTLDRSFENGTYGNLSQAPKKSGTGRNNGPLQDASMSTMRTLGGPATNERGPSGSVDYPPPGGTDPRGGKSITRAEYIDAQTASHNPDLQGHLTI